MAEAAQASDYASAPDDQASPHRWAKRLEALKELEREFAAFVASSNDTLELSSVLLKNRS